MDIHADFHRRLSTMLDECDRRTHQAYTNRDASDIYWREATRRRAETDCAALLEAVAQLLPAFCLAVPNPIEAVREMLRTAQRIDGGDALGLESPA